MRQAARGEGWSRGARGRGSPSNHDLARVHALVHLNHAQEVLALLAVQALSRVQRNEEQVRQ